MRLADGIQATTGYQAETQAWAIIQKQKTKSPDQGTIQFHWCTDYEYGSRGDKAGK